MRPGRTPDVRLAALRPGDLHDGVDPLRAAQRPVLPRVPGVVTDRPMAVQRRMTGASRVMRAPGAMPSLVVPRLVVRGLVVDGVGEQHPRTPSDDAVGTEVMAALEVADRRPGVAGEVAGVADAKAALQPAHGGSAGAEPQHTVRRPLTDCMTMGGPPDPGPAGREPTGGVRTADCSPGPRP